MTCEPAFQIPNTTQWVRRCADDAEFALAARHWNGGLRFASGTQVFGFTVHRGVPKIGLPCSGEGVLAFAAAPPVWAKLLAATPPRLFNDLAPLLDRGTVLAKGDVIAHAQYFAAAMRAIEILRPTSTLPSANIGQDSQRASFDCAVGRYIHLDLCGVSHRVYFEEAGKGIPLLVQHTAGSDASQWRHLLETPAITDRFRVIAYDLPFHGKSLPPTEVEWWTQQYRLNGDFLRSVPIGLSSALDLERPVFMGCSVGGLLALDLAARHPDLFRAVISLEGALKVIEDSAASLQTFWHPQVNDEYKARMMEGMMSPTSPLANRKETAFAYAAAWPPAFLGDLHYYQTDYDLRAGARSIDTQRIAVHILSGEYDWSGSSERGRAAHEAIPGSTWQEMKGLGHFPMSENPTEFLKYLLPILEVIAQSLD